MPKCWDSICLPKSVGGLGFKRMFDVNKALIAKLVWSVASSHDKLWVWLLTQIALLIIYICRVCHKSNVILIGLLIICICRVGHKSNWIHVIFLFLKMIHVIQLSTLKVQYKKQMAIQYYIFLYHSQLVYLGIMINDTYTIIFPLNQTRNQYMIDKSEKSSLSKINLSEARYFLCYKETQSSPTCQNLQMR